MGWILVVDCPSTRIAVADVGLQQRQDICLGLDRQRVFQTHSQLDGAPFEDIESGEGGNFSVLGNDVAGTANGARHAGGDKKDKNYRNEQK